nr:(2Fe-2S)-binding protein [Spirosomataceae bacterium]
ASLREINQQVTVVQRIGRMMDRQLDPLGSAILHEEIVARGIEVFYNDEVEQFYGQTQIKGGRLKSGQRIDCQAIIAAAGTVPNVQLAVEAGLECNRGIELSDKRLQLLRSGQKAEPVLGKLVCSCNGVGEGNLLKAIESGCTDFTSLCQRTGAGTGCGSCRPEVRGILEGAAQTVA